LGIAEINRFLQEKLRELGKAEIEAVPAAALLDQQGLLSDSQHRRGLPLRKLLRAGKIKGAYQYPNARWVIRKTTGEDMYSVKEAARELGLSENAIYKRLEKGLIKYEVLGEKSMMIPASEIELEKQQRSGEDTNFNNEQLVYQLGLLKRSVQDITERMQTVVRHIDQLEKKMTQHEYELSFDSIQALEEQGFEGFYTVDELRNAAREIPAERGVYLVLYLKKTRPEFLSVSSGGWFKGEDPTVNVTVLEEKWILNTPVIYIGQAGGGTSKATLHSRISQLLDFGNGKAVGHKGGRYLWQIKDSHELVLCWKTTVEDDPRQVEHDLLRAFISQYGILPFANLKE
jgi:hypothetical protein